MYTAVVYLVLRSMVLYHDVRVPASRCVLYSSTQQYPRYPGRYQVQYTVPYTIPYTVPGMLAQRQLGPASFNLLYDRTRTCIPVRYHSCYRYWVVVVVKNRSKHEMRPKCHTHTHSHQICLRPYDVVVRLSYTGIPGI